MSSKVSAEAKAFAGVPPAEAGSILTRDRLNADLKVRTTRTNGKTDAPDPVQCVPEDTAPRHSPPET